MKTKPKFTHLSRDDRLSVAVASRLLRAIYDVSNKTVAKAIGYRRDYFNQFERSDEFTRFPPSDEMIAAIGKYFDLEVSQLVKVGNCKTPINAFYYLQEIKKL
jgi:DNA-binding XRE family transcriptional regulator